MARIAPTPGQKISFLTFILISAFILYLDITTNNLKSIKNGFKSFKISVNYVVKASTLEPIKSLTKSFKNKNELISENEVLKEALDLSYLNNYLISRENIFYKDKEIIKKIHMNSEFSPTYNIAKLKNIDPNMYKCCDRHRMFLEIIDGNDFDFHESVVFNYQGIVGQIIDESKFYEVLLLTDIAHSLPIKSESNNFFCNAKGSGRAGYIMCNYNPLIWTEDIRKNQTFYTSGLGGIYPRNVEIGHISKINNINSNEIVLEIKLVSNPLDSNLFGVFTDL
tara:strand:+ start:53 stop:892 length:840 start_codon:yes stop_codon:yes gene_type:complete